MFKKKKKVVSLKIILQVISVFFAAATLSTSHSNRGPGNSAFVFILPLQSGTIVHCICCEFLLFCVYLYPSLMITSVGSCPLKGGRISSFVADLCVLVCVSVYVLYIIVQILIPGLGTD